MLDRDPLTPAEKEVAKRTAEALKEILLKQPVEMATIPFERLTK
jgi:hypothetical protein